MPDSCQEFVGIKPKTTCRISLKTNIKLLFASLRKSPLTMFIWRRCFSGLSSQNEPTSLLFSFTSTCFFYPLSLQHYPELEGKVKLLLIVGCMLGEKNKRMEEEDGDNGPLWKCGLISALAYWSPPEVVTIQQCNTPLWLNCGMTVSSNYCMLKWNYLLIHSFKVQKMNMLP